MARTSKHSPRPNTEAPQPLPGEPTEHTQILMKLAQMERATLVMADAIKTQMRVEHSFTASPEMLKPVASQIAMEIMGMIAIFEGEVYRLKSLVENIDGLQDLPDWIGKAKTTCIEEMMSLETSIIQGLMRIRDEAIIETRAVANSCRNDVSSLATSATELMEELEARADKAKEAFTRTMEQAISDGRVALNAQVGEVRTELRKSTAAAEAVHGRIGTTAASMEAALDHFDYCNPATSVSAERRLKAVTRHAGLIQSAATVAGVAIVEMLLHVMGMR